jgi:hypothetical protein
LIELAILLTQKNLIFIQALLRKMDAIVAQVQKLAANADEAGRKKVIDALRDLSYAIETPYDTLQRFAGLVSRLNTF